MSDQLGCHGKWSPFRWKRWTTCERNINEYWRHHLKRKIYLQLLQKTSSIFIKAEFCSPVLIYISIISPLCLRLRDHCRREGKSVRIRKFAVRLCLPEMWEKVPPIKSHQHIYLDMKWTRAALRSWGLNLRTLQATQEFQWWRMIFSRAEHASWLSYTK